MSQTPCSHAPPHACVDPAISDVLFIFERDFAETLRCVPMIVRWKLDRCRIKLSLRAWSWFDRITCQRLASMPVENALQLRRYLHLLLRAIVFQAEERLLRLAPEAVTPLWLGDAMPERVQAWIAAHALRLDGPRSCLRWSASCCSSSPGQATKT